MRHKPQPKLPTFVSPRLRFALCDPSGVPFIIAHSPEICLGHYVDMRGGIILDAESQEWYFRSMRHRKWSIRRIVTTVTVGETIAEVEELRRQQKLVERRERRRQPVRDKKARA